MSTHVKLQDTIEPRQQTGNIVITLEPLVLDEELTKEFYFANFEVQTRNKITNENETRYLNNYHLRNFFKGHSAFFVKIENNTPHILRMRDSRVLFIDPKLNEPIFAVDRLKIAEEIVKGSFPAKQELLTSFQASFPVTPAEMLNRQLTQALMHIAGELKFVNNFENEIIPGMQSSGYLVFPVDPEKISQGQISFIDMISKTDAAGNPIEKVRFDYHTSVFNRFWEMDPNKNEWIEIEEPDYQNGLYNPKTYIYERKAKQWVVKVN